MSKYRQPDDSAPIPFPGETSSMDHHPVRIAVVVSRYNALITERLYDGAEQLFRTNAPKGSTMVRVDAPGSFELPALCLAAAATQAFDGVVALGCIIKGETIHDRVIADAIATGILNATLASGVPIAFGVITADNEDQAHARAGGAVGNKGSEAMAANLETINAIRGLAMSHMTIDPMDDAMGDPMDEDSGEFAPHEKQAIARVARAAGLIDSPARKPSKKAAKKPVQKPAKKSKGTRS